MSLYPNPLVNLVPVWSDDIYSTDPSPIWLKVFVMDVLGLHYFQMFDGFDW